MGSASTAKPAAPAIAWFGVNPWTSGADDDEDQCHEDEDEDEDAITSTPSRLCLIYRPSSKPGADELVWRKQFDQLADAVAPHTFEIDGARFIGEMCQPAVARAYSAMLQVGYAKGWVA